MSSLEFKKKVIMKMVAAGYIEGYNVTLSTGFFHYMLPIWVHRLHLNIMIKVFDDWACVFTEIVEELFNEKL